LADQRCIACEVRGALVCRACRRGLPWLVGPLCGRCGEPVAADRIGCPVCVRLGSVLGAVRSAVALDGAATDAVRAWKDAARAPVAQLAERCIASVVMPPDALIVPVPAAQDRAAWRGVDGPADLAARLGRRWRLAVHADALERQTACPQRGLSATGRRRNAADAFVARRSITGRVLLVDDVMTTGATLVACARRLRQAGAVRVDAVTFARVVTIP
jgi:ComF family protein